MSSFMDFYQDFLQKKESNDGRRTSAVSLPEEDASDVSANESMEQGLKPSKKEDVVTENVKKMEHIFNRDSAIKPTTDVSTGLAPVRTILVRKTPQCASCNVHPIDELETNEGNQAIVPSFNEIAGKEAMNECARIAKYVKNVNSDDDDWEARIIQSGWTSSQKSLYDKVVKILDSDYLGRLANIGRQNEVIQRRILIDRSAHRMRKVLVSINWDSRLTQWLHCLLLDYLPPSYMASYLDILQTLKSKVPSLIDKMLFMRPLNTSQELLAPVMKKQWEPIINSKNRILSHNAIFVAIPSLPFGSIPRRLHRWYQNFGNIAPIYQIALPSTSGQMLHQPLEQVAEQIVSLSRVKIQELRHEDPARSIILIGFGAGSAFALQVAMSEAVAAVVCLGFSYNTINGPRGNPDDRLLDIKVPILFVIGQNSQRTSSEEMECLRERLQSESSMVLVGCADDFLRLPKTRRKLENVTQSMVDSMIVDEVYDFIKKILANPPGPRTQAAIANLTFTKQKSTLGSDGKTSNHRKRKSDGSLDHEISVKGKFVPQIGRPRTRPLVTTSNLINKPKVSNISTSSHRQTKADGDEINKALQSILQDCGAEDMESSSPTEKTENAAKKIVTNFELVPQSKSNPMKAILNSSGGSGTKIRMIPSNQFVQLKPSTAQTPTKFITIKSGISTPSQSTSLANIVKSTVPPAGAQQQIFTLKASSGQTTQFVTASSSAQKYTVVKNPIGTGTTLQLAKNVTEPATTSKVDLSNIIDMPIIFADSDGNIADTVPPSKSLENQISEASKSGSVGQLIINQKVIREPNGGTSAETSKSSGTIVFTKPAGTSNSTLINTPFTKQGNKVLYINRSTMKPCSNIISRPNVNQKFANVLVTTPKMSGAATIVPRPGMIISTTSPSAPISSTNTSIVSSVKPTAIQTIKSAATTVTRPTSGILNVSTKTLPQLQIVNTPNVVSGANVTNSGDKPQIRNIVLKGGFKQLTPQLGTQLLNRNVTVRKLNIVPINRQAAPPGGISVAPVSAANQGSADTSPTQGPSIQSSPKILTLTPNAATSSPATHVINSSGDSD